MSTAATVRRLKQNDQDHEWYPTTDEMIQRVVRNAMNTRSYSSQRYKVLDVGAGDGRVLEAFYKVEDYPVAECFAIEKSAIHIANLPKHIQMLGTDFREQHLADKQMDVIFSNPPYSEFETWAYRLIRESNTRYLYLIMPRRWRDSDRINAVVKIRGMEVKSLGEFDFEDGERSARAKVEIVRFQIPQENRDNVDAFIEEVLPQLSVFDLPPVEKPSAEETAEALIKGGRNVIEVLVESHDREIAELVSSFQSLDKVDPVLLGTLGITKHVVLDLIRGKIQAAKKRYWELLFAELETLRTRLATRQRREFVEKINSRAAVDFTESNILAVLVWVSKWVNSYFDEQTVALFRTLSNESNCVRYKSNQRVWTNGDWRYRGINEDEKEQRGPYKLEFRMVLSSSWGGIETPDQWGHKSDRYNGLTETSFNMLSDIIVTANNLHFETVDTPRNYTWESNKSNVLKRKDGTPLVEVKAFKNGNMHLRFAPDFMLALNVEAGRLLGWIRNPSQACDDLDISDPEERDAVAKSFGTAFKIGAPTTLLLGRAAPETSTP